MPKVAVVFADGCEEIEGLTQVDVLRRLGITCDMVGLTKLEITGGHDIKFSCDKILADDLYDYDLVSFPGGMTGAENLRDNDKLMGLMKKRHADGKWCAAMCAAPIAFDRYGLLQKANYTCYPGFEKDISSNNPQSTFSDDIVIVDSREKLITSRGPATALAFSYKIAETLGIDTSDLQNGMLYSYLMKQK
ncbi:MAG: DJ-1/PfpI family protein [Lactobacillus sp.]|nr:DJ-1/PfpI family protein [Lactobacillus sp.]